MAQPVETATDYKHTHKDLGLIMVNVYGFVFHASSMLTDRQTDATKRIISPASRLIINMNQYNSKISQVSTILIGSSINHQ